MAEFTAGQLRDLNLDIVSVVSIDALAYFSKKLRSNIIIGNATK